MNEVVPNFRDKNVQSAVKNLFAYSLLILVLPLGSMFGLKILLFEGYSSNESIVMAFKCCLRLSRMEESGRYDVLGNSRNYSHLRGAWFLDQGRIQRRSKRGEAGLIRLTNTDHNAISLTARI